MRAQQSRVLGRTQTYAQAPRMVAGSCCRVHLRHPQQCRLAPCLGSSAAGAADAVDRVRILNRFGNNARSSTNGQGLPELQQNTFHGAMISTELPRWVQGRSVAATMFTYAARHTSARASTKSGTSSRCSCQHPFYSTGQGRTLSVYVSMPGLWSA